MNAADRKRITELHDKAEKLIGLLEEFETEARDIGTGEEEKFENLSEGLQQAESGQALEAAAQLLIEAADAAESAKESVAEFLEKLNEAKGDA